VRTLLALRRLGGAGCIPITIITSCELQSRDASSTSRPQLHLFAMWGQDEAAGEEATGDVNVCSIQIDKVDAALTGWTPLSPPLFSLAPPSSVHFLCFSHLGTPHPSLSPGTGDAFCSIFTAWVELLGMARIHEALVKTTSSVQELIRVTMALQQQGRAPLADGSAASAVRSRELQVTPCFCSLPSALCVTAGLQVVAGRHFISCPPEYDGSKVRVWSLSPAAVALLEQQ
jgi:hypothetical protein